METKSIYTVGGTVEASKRLYLTRKADQELLELCRSGQFSYILAPRQVGKSSLMMRTSQRLAEDGIKSVIIDLTQLGTQVTAEAWYLGLLAIIEDQLMLDTPAISWWKSHADLGITQRLTRFFEEVLLRETSSPVVIFVDEIDTTLSLTFTDDFFASIRYFYQARVRLPEFQRLTFVLVGVATPGDLIRDPARTPFNIGQRLEMTDFTFEEALPLAQGLNVPPDDATQVLRWVLKWTGGHPYLTQRLCRVITEQRGEIDWNEDKIDELVANTFFGEKSEQDNNLQFVRDMLTRRVLNLEEVLMTYREIRLEKNPVLDQEQSVSKSHLKLSGVVKREGRALKVRNSIYRTVFDEKWIKEYLPVNWAKRLRQAFRLIMAISVLALVMGGLAIYALIQQGEANKQADEARNQRNVAENQRQEAEIARNQADRLRRSAEAQSLAFQSETQTDPELSLLLSIEAASRIQDEKLDDTGGQVEAALRQNLASYTPNIALRSPATIIYTVKFSPDGKRLVTAGDDGYARVYETGTSREIMALGGKFGRMYEAIFSPDGSLISTIDEKGNTILYDAKTGKQQGDIISCNCQISYQEFSPDGKWLAQGLDNVNRLVRVLEVATGKVLWQEWDGAGNIVSTVFSPDGKWLASASGEKFFLYDLTSTSTPPLKPYKIPSAFNGAVNGNIVFSPDSRKLVFTNNDYTAHILDTTTGKFTFTLRHTSFINNVSFTPDGKKILTACSDKTVKVWETETGKELYTYLGHTAAVQDVILSPDGNLAVSTGNDSSIRVWDYTNGKEVAVLNGHSGALSGTSHHGALSFSPDGKWLASGANDGTARLWDWQTISQKKLILTGNTNRLNTATYSSDGKTIFTIANNNLPRLYDSQTGRQILTLSGHIPHVMVGLWFYPGALSPDGNLAVTTIGFNDNTARIWDIVSGKELVALDDEEYPQFTSTQDNKFVAGARKDFSLEIWDFVTDKLLLNGMTGHNGEITGLAFSPDDRYLASASRDQTVRVWDTNNGKTLTVLQGHNAAVLSLDFSPDGKYLVTAGADKTLRLWNTITWQPETVMTGHTAEVRSVLFSPDGQTVFSGSSDGTVRKWDVTTGQEMLVFRGHTGAINNVAVSSDGKRIATASDDSTARVWDAQNGSEQLILKGHTGAVTAVCFKLNSSNRVYTGGADKTFRLWDGNSGDQIKVNTGFTKPIKRIYTAATDPEILATFPPLPGLPEPEEVAYVVTDNTLRGFDFLHGYGLYFLLNKPPLFGAIFSPDSKLVATGGGDKKVRLWDSKTGKLVRILEGHTNTTRFSGNAHFSPDGTRLAAGSSDKTAIIWEVSTGKQLLTLTGHTDTVITACFSPDGKLIVTAGYDNTARVWDATTGKQLKILKGHTGPLNAARFSPDGKFILTASEDSTARIWDAVSGQELAVVRGHSKAINDASFSPDGKSILTAGEDSIAIVQPCDICNSFADTLAQAKKTVTRSLTEEEKTRFGIQTVALVPVKPNYTVPFARYREEE
jgi:WD40 repeat protein